MELKKLKWEVPELITFKEAITGNGNFAIGVSCDSGSGATGDCISGGQAEYACDNGTNIVS